MTEPEITKPDAGELIRKLHERPQMLWPNGCKPLRMCITKRFA